jgi:23S rRNA U2552 (ribose-2'-O)-methylase RlmE/FtsJ
MKDIDLVRIEPIPNVITLAADIAMDACRTTLRKEVMKCECLTARRRAERREEMGPRRTGLIVPCSNVGNMLTERCSRTGPACLGADSVFRDKH